MRTERIMIFFFFFSCPLMFIWLIYLFLFYFFFCMCVKCSVHSFFFFVFFFHFFHLFSLLLTTNFLLLISFFFFCSVFVLLLMQLFLLQFFNFIVKRKNEGKKTLEKLNIFLLFFCPPHSLKIEKKFEALLNGNNFPLFLLFSFLFASFVSISLFL